MREDICTIPISEVFEPRDGCPICRMRDMLEDRMATYITGAAMMEPDVRIETNRLGFCKDHFDQILARGSRLSVALILESLLQEVEKDVFPDGKADQKTAAKKLLPAAERRAHSCFVCENIEMNMNHLMETVIKLWQSEPDFRKLYAEQPCICFQHYRTILQAATKMNKKVFPEFQEVTRSLAMKYLKEVEVDVTHFCRMFDYRNKDADWGNSRDSIERAIWFLTSRHPQVEANAGEKSREIMSDTFSMKTITPALFDPDHTLDCGQSFRWEKSGDVWQGIAFGRRLCLQKQGEQLVFDCSQAEFDSIWRSYFDLDTEYARIRQQLSAMDPVLEKACAYAGGIHILRQDPWEALCSFIISQNNNIPRIKGIIQRMCETLGERSAEGLLLFPTPQRLASSSLEELAPLRAGFRAKYLLSAARLVTEGKVDLQAISSMEIGKARETLMLIHGVGPKVAECALLYGFHRLEAFPMDVWMKRVMERWFPDKKPEDFGAYAGIAQQYLFHYIRTFEEENF